MPLCAGDLVQPTFGASAGNSLTTSHLSLIFLALILHQHTSLQLQVPQPLKHSFISSYAITLNEIWSHDGLSTSTQPKKVAQPCSEASLWSQDINPTQHSPHLRAPNWETSWQPPPIGLYKANVDVAMYVHAGSIKGCVVELVIWDEPGTLACLRLQHLPIRDHHVVEVRAILFALETLLWHKFLLLIVQSDSLVAVLQFHPHATSRSLHWEVEPYI